MGLTEYKRKRDFRASAEPKGKGKKTPHGRRAAQFVIQKHDASRLHYDFRLEMDGVLKSWAVPKGLPWMKGEKHLAVEVEDHPIDYADFEGIIPKGQYGGGTVMVWDRGTYEAEGDEPLKALRSGRLTLHMDGEKARGEWTLIRIRSNESKPQWLLMKTGEAIKPITKKRDDQSAKTGRTMKQIAAAPDAEWQSKRLEDKQASASSRLRVRIQKALKKESSAAPEKPGKRLSVAGSNVRRGVTKKNSPAFALSRLPKAGPRFIEPMKPRLLEEPPSTGDWVYEIKFDGIRAA